MPRRRDNRSPIWRDVKKGSPTGLSGGYFVMNDGETAPAYYGFITRLDGVPILRLDGARLQRLDRNS